MQVIENYPKVTPANFVVFYLPGVFLEVGAKLFSQLFKKNAWPRSRESLLPPKYPSERDTSNLISNFYPSTKPPPPKKLQKPMKRKLFASAMIRYHIVYFLLNQNSTLHICVLQVKMLRDLVPLGVLLMFFLPGGADDSSLAKLPIEQKVIPNRIFPPGIAPLCKDALKVFLKHSHL